MGASGPVLYPSSSRSFDIELHVVHLNMSMSISTDTMRKTMSDQVADQVAAQLDS